MGDYLYIPLLQESTGDCERLVYKFAFHFIEINFIILVANNSYCLLTIFNIINKAILQFVYPLSSVVRQLYTVVFA